MRTEPGCGAGSTAPVLRDRVSCQPPTADAPPRRPTATSLVVVRRVRVRLSSAYRDGDVGHAASSSSLGRRAGQRCRGRSQLLLLRRDAETDGQRVAGPAEVLLDGALAACRGSRRSRRPACRRRSAAPPPAPAAAGGPGPPPRTPRLPGSARRQRLPSSRQLGGRPELDHPAPELRDREVGAGTAHPQVRPLQVGDLAPACGRPPASPPGRCPRRGASAPGRGPGRSGAEARRRRSRRTPRGATRTRHAEVRRPPPGSIRS